MHPEIAKLYASQQQATPAEETVVYDLTEMATADEWVEAKGKRGGLVARNKRSGRVLYGSRARAVLARSRRRGGGGSLFQRKSGFVGDINRKPGLTVGKATGVTRSRAKPAPTPTAKETLGKVLKETPDKPLSGKQVRAEVKDKKQTPARGKAKVERRKETEKPAKKEPWQMTHDELLQHSPQLFEKIMDRYTNGVGHENAYASYLEAAIKSGKDVPLAIRKKYGVRVLPHEKTLGEAIASRRVETRRGSPLTRRGGREFDAEDERHVREAHRSNVEAALAAGKPVPPEVLADYPDLAQKGA